MDLNERATTIATVNGQLNAIAHVAYSVGDWFEAVDDEDRRFDLVVGNLPFVAAPLVVFQFAHGRMDPNELSRRIIRGAATRINDSAIAHILTSWTRGADEDRPARVSEFIEGTGCERSSWPTEQTTRQNMPPSNAAGSRRATHAATDGCWGSGWITTARPAPRSSNTG